MAELTANTGLKVVSARILLTYKTEKINTDWKCLANKQNSEIKVEEVFYENFKRERGLTIIKFWGRLGLNPSGVSVVS